MLDDIKVLLAHDWLLTWAGSERVVEQILTIFPNADVVSTIVDPSVAREHLPQARLRELWVGKIPGARRHHQWLLPLEAVAFGLCSTAQYRLVISSAHALSKSIGWGSHQTHICYCHSPPRYLWDEFETYRSTAPLHRRVILQIARRPLQLVDRAAAKGVTHFVANSQFVADRIRRAYGRLARVVYPPVRAKAPGAGTSGTRDSFLLYLGRLVSYKRVDLLVRASKRLGVRAVIAGDGPESARLKEMAGPTVEFLGRVTEGTAAELLNQCAAFVFCGREDFGIAPVEANAHGAPVISLRAGGVLESMVEGVTGVFFDDADVDSLCDAIRIAFSRTWDQERLKANAARFSPHEFRLRFAEVVQDALSGQVW